MNITTNTTMASNNIQDIVNKIPSYIYFSEMPDRKQALKYVNYLYENVPESKTVDQDKLFREVIARELRIINMKLIEPEILIMVGLNKITINDFTSSSNELVSKIIAENPDKYDLDMLYRVLAQIMTKLPKDLKESVAGKHKLQIFQLLAKFIKMEPKLCEKFISLDPTLNTASSSAASLNTPITMELEQGDYNTLNKKYLNELYNFQQQKSYLNSNSLEYGALASQMVQTMPNAALSNGKLQRELQGQYIDLNPDLMLGANDNKLYYFDASSGTISEMPINANQTPVSMGDLKTILGRRKINQGEIQTAINSFNLTTQPILPTPTATIPSGFINTLENMFSGLKTGTTQAQAVITTQANLPLNSPIPPVFLTQLYNIKQGDEQDQQDQQDQQGYRRKYQYNNDNNNANYTSYNQVSQSNNPLYANRNPATITTTLSHTTPTLPHTIHTLSPTIPTIPKIPTITTTTPPPTTTQASISHFNNMNNDIINSIDTKIKNNNKDVENIAVGFVTIIILLFLIAIFNSIKSNKK